MKITRTVLLSVLLTLGFYVTTSIAQVLEPRAYINTPTGLNFFLAAYSRSEGGLSTDPSLPIENAELDLDTVILAYVRSLKLGGKSGKFDIILPYSDLNGSALVSGEFRERLTHGLGDPRLRLSYNFYGAPALSAQEFSRYKQDLVIGTSLQISAPAGEYDSDRLVNLGTNRWSIKPDIGLSKVLGKFIVDFTLGVTLYSDNENFYGGQTREQEPIYSIQSNISYNFRRGMWAALGGTYYIGGKSTVDGLVNNDELRNSRVGFLFAYPLSPQQSIKLNLSRGVTTRVGTSFETIGVAWQYRWGGGL